MELIPKRNNVYSNSNLLNNKKSWDKLSMKDRATLILLGVASGVYDIDTIRDTYNEFAEGGELPSITKKKKKKKTAEVNPFIYANSTKSGGNWDLEFAKQFNDSIIANKNNISFSPEAIAYVIGSESGYDKFASNKISSAVGPIQLLKGSLINMYGDEAGAAAHQEYVDKTRSDANIIHDTMNFLRMVEGKVNKNVGDMSAGRLKQNLLSPNHSITKIIPANVFNTSIPKQIKANLKLGESTYLDYINEFNRGYNDFYKSYLDVLNEN